MSLPVWGEWIEIVKFSGSQNLTESLPVWGEWIEIIVGLGGNGGGGGLSPCGESGLK